MRINLADKVAYTAVIVAAVILIAAIRLAIKLGGIG
jgi:hypothetical protein